MRLITGFVATAFIFAAASAMACPMQTAAKSQTVASSGANSTPIPAKARQADEG